MKFVRILLDDEYQWGVLEGKYVRLIDGAPYEGWSYLGTELKASKAKFRAPAAPGKIVCVGKNYADHAAELGMEVPDQPILFLKPSTCVNDPEAEIPYPNTVGRLDYEGELAVVIGRTATRIKPQNADRYICGFTILNDVTARDVQQKDGQWTRAKSYDGFAPIGPCIESDLNYWDVPVITRLNGEVRQQGDTKQFLWDIPALLAYITECMTLEPGDIVSTGTPAGIGAMQIGDTVEIEIPGIGVLRNTVGRRKGDVRA
ncbi:fumarylacetoacetate hydrolase family protein [Intestinibacillus massiliensis]|uniref:fumarylacetoacetate hydrolase family protein n=1 Tax=Intestinibacillus massiliensis TaxID=1871029 RepID=UPI000B3640BA|nr:fumarylacetoacetate hydrolase family protein [Intestinibacillus massiliensis]